MNLDLSNKPPKFNRAVYDDIARRRAHGETLAEIAAVYHVSKTTISQKLQRLARQRRHDQTIAALIVDRTQ